MKQTQNSESNHTLDPVEHSEQNTTTPNNETAPQKTTARKSTGNTTAQTRRTASSSPAAAKKQPSKKKVRPLQTIEDAQRSEDEALDEALDEVITDEESVSVEIPVDAPEEVVPSSAGSSNLLRRIKQRREKQAEQNMSALELICKKSGFTEDDVAMIFELGYESELGRLVGYETLKRFRYERMHRSARETARHYRTAFGYCGREDITTAIKEKTIATYMRDRKYLILRTLLTALITFLTILLDVPSLLGNGFSDFAITYPSLFPSISTILLIIAAVLSYRQLNAGLRSFYKLSPTPYSTLAMIVPATVLYNVASLILQLQVLQVTCLASGVLLLLSLCDVMRLVGEMRVFRLLATDSPKTVLETTEPRKKKLKQGKKLIKIINDDLDESFYHVHVATQTMGFFRRFNNMSAAHRPFRILLTAPVALAFVSAFIICLSADLQTAMNAFIAIVMLGTPALACFGFFFPLCRANKILTHYNTALIGEEAVEEYNDSKTVIFNDEKLCYAKSCTELSVRQSDDLRKDLKLAGILFRKIGGALQTLDQATPGKTQDPAVAFVHIADTGVEAVIDNQYHVIAGNAEFLKKSGVRVPRETTDRALRRAVNVGVLYIAVDGVLKLSYEIEYGVDTRFEELAERLADPDTSIAIQSYDPSLNAAFLQNLRAEDAVPVRVIKPGKYESLAPLEISDTGAVSLGNEEHIVYPLYAAKKVYSAKRTALVLQYVITSLGAVGVTLLSLLSLQSYLTPLAIGAFHLLWILISYIVSIALINKQTLYLRRDRSAHMKESDTI